MVTLEGMTKREALEALAAMKAQRDELAAVIEKAKAALSPSIIHDTVRDILGSADTEAALREWHERQHEGETLTIASDWIVAVVDGCTNGCPAEYGHQRGCGLEPLVNVSEHMRGERARAVERAAQAIVQWDHLFGPDAHEWLIAFAQEIRAGEHV